jgi:hypothetical protein
MPAPEINLGNRVKTADGRDIGQVREILEACFRVDASLHADYWFGADVIESSKGNEIQIKLNRSQLERPHSEGHEGYHQHV